MYAESALLADRDCRVLGAGQDENDDVVVFTQAKVGFTATCRLELKAPRTAINIYYFSFLSVPVVTVPPAVIGVDAVDLGKSNLLEYGW